MRLGKIVTLLLAGFLTFSSLNSFAATKDAKTKSNISTKKQTTSKVTKKAVKTSKKATKKVVKKSSTVKKKSAKELHKNPTRKYFQTGIASYYANKFNGRRTANGEIFSNAKMTAAHRTLPFGTLIEVTNLRNGRSVIVRINDRGPYIHPRVVDLSSAAAKKIGMHHSGIARVKIDILNQNAKAGSTKKLYARN
ncbi:septal ring lytic transglycosylase RlpA family protein [Mannheimia sp. AT1]|uniref:Endolytic peptidoglycan transglycosylase RlpA n=1 Tax=Mannheimia cairinae TaxID=3025936 RepID=A0ABT5MQ49_9PAST|nr:septal ring lytic transglycosylase RlpA family protein [Mannheimia cairinae]MDD0824311.1 septal ring lytic transglycosylase RlpA family protein [Mannheimia cairinae]MDD0826566.1 septal ring lytic transglycosylase RlpA family protein [Mannheimia cairinae]